MCFTAVCGEMALHIHWQFYDAGKVNAVVNKNRWLHLKSDQTKSVHKIALKLRVWFWTREL